MVDLTNGKKRTLESGAEDEAVKKKAKPDNDVEAGAENEPVEKKKAKEEGAENEPVKKKRVKLDSEAKKERLKFLKKYFWSCWDFASTGKCSYGVDCQFNHTTKKGELIQKTNMEKIPTPTFIYSGKCRKIFRDDKTYSGVLRWNKINNRYGFISIENDITFKDLTVTKRIFVRKKNITVGSEEGVENKKPEVIFKVYKDRKGLGAFDVTSKDGSPVLFHGKFKKCFDSNEKPKKKKSAGKARKRLVWKAKRRENRKAMVKLRKEKALKEIENIEKNDKI